MHYAVNDRAHYAVDDRAHYAVNDRAHDGRITLTLEEKYQLSLYEKVTRLSDDKQIWLVKNIETNEIYVRKELLLYNFEVYAQLKEKQFDNIPKVIECVEEENRLIVIEEYIHGKTLETVMESMEYYRRKMRRLLSDRFVIFCTSCMAIYRRSYIVTSSHRILSLALMES